MGLQRYRGTVLNAAVTGELTGARRKTHKPDESAIQLLKRLPRERRSRWEKGELKRLKTAGKSLKTNTLPYCSNAFVSPAKPKPRNRKSSVCRNRNLNQSKRWKNSKDSSTISAEKQRQSAYWSGFKKCKSPAEINPAGL